MKCTAAEAETQRSRGWEGKSLSDDSAVRVLCVGVLCVEGTKREKREEFRN